MAIRRLDESFFLTTFGKAGIGDDYVYSVEAVDTLSFEELRTFFERYPSIGSTDEEIRAFNTELNKLIKSFNKYIRIQVLSSRFAAIRMSKVSPPSEIADANNVLYEQMSVINNISDIELYKNTTLVGFAYVDGYSKTELSAFKLESGESLINYHREAKIVADTILDKFKTA